MVRAARRCSQREAMRIVMGGEDSMCGIGAKQVGKPAKRAPLTENGATSTEEASVLSISVESGEVLTMAPGCGLRAFLFDRAFDASSDQKGVYDLCARSAVADLFNGLSGCILVYGQTGSGKTYSMFGEQDADSMFDQTHKRLGIVPRTCEEVMSAIAERRESMGIDAELRLAYVEVYGSQVTDLLRNGARIGSDDSGEAAANSFHAHKWVLEGRADVAVSSVKDVLALLERGEACKRKAATAMNERSSRAHALVVLLLAQRFGGVELTNRLFLADLGGSEKLSKSDVAKEFKAPVLMVGNEEVSRVSWREYYQHRGRLQESLNINVGLYALKRCIEALIRRADGQGSAHVPFGDSKLTQILRPALEGGARTTVLICASLEKRNAVESIQSLRFGEACSRVETRLDTSAEGAAVLRRVVAQLDSEISEVQALIIRDQRWEKRVTTRFDVVELKDDFSSHMLPSKENGGSGDGGNSGDVYSVAPDAHSIMSGMWTTDELRAELRKRGLPVRASSKEELKQRLVDALGADGTVSEVRRETIAHEVVANVLVGAEEHESRLELLLQRRRALTGEA